MSIKKLKTNGVEIDIDDVGPVLFEQSNRAIRLIISVKYPKRVRVVVPRGYNLDAAIKYVHKKTSWIKKQQQKMLHLRLKLEDFNRHKSLIDKKIARKKLTDRLNYLAEKYGFHYILTSAKTGDNVNDAFLYIAYRFLETT